MNLNKILLSILFSFFALINLTFSQAEFPEDGPVFRDDMVPRVDIIIPQDTLNWIYDNVDSNTEFRATFIFSTDTIKDTIPEVGFRLRGNTSRNSNKKSFKVSFNTFRPGRKFYGLEKTNLNGEHNDPSIIRSKIALDLMRDFGIPASRANHVLVYINGSYYGLYIQVEHVDEEYVESRFNNKNGNLYKCLWPADLDYKGVSPDNYKYMQGDRRVYDLKTNTAIDDYSDIANFINVLNNIPSASIECEIEKSFNVYDYLKVIALDVFLGNWDGPIYNKNNFYLYYNTDSKRMEYIPYDLDNTLGIDWIGRDWGTRDIYDWNQHEGERPIYTKLIGSDELKKIYSQYMSDLLSEEMTGSNFNSRILAIKDMILPYVTSDPFYPLDYGFTVQDFNESYISGLGGHVDYGLLEYIETRRTSALQQLQDFQEQAVINHIRYKVKNDGQDLRVRAYTAEQVNSLQLIYTENDGSPISIEMYDDGLHFDKEANDGVYANSIENIALGTKISYQIKSVFNSSIRISPCDPIEYFFQESAYEKLVINEFMALNASIIADESGDYGDWIEIYNADDDEVYLGDKYLSDNISNPNKWQMPDMNLQPGNFALFWADASTEKGIMHTNFKLSGGGEEIGIFDAENTGFTALDTLHYESQIIDNSLGRYPDGGDEWRYFTLPTPGYSNAFDAVYNEEKENPLLIYPNPSSIGILYFDKISSLQLYSMNGVLLKEVYQSSQMDIHDLKTGIYLLRNKNGVHHKVIIQN